ncbi:hypothetical protein ACO22_00969 [Paracoccidioides brasiliensis]|uniref:Uncharacterized protein n=1 Tax=Paracoccidioides brasiliensis TaxID=121759 RepID=A0A1D2JMQ3_PARBR|nr:hypothetical protein ACO22_00969 [Paracoccidioides brasiliensis]
MIYDDDDDDDDDDDVVVKPEEVLTSHRLVHFSIHVISNLLKDRCWKLEDSTEPSQGMRMKQIDKNLLYHEMSYWTCFESLKLPNQDRLSSGRNAVNIPLD